MIKNSDKNNKFEYVSCNFCNNDQTKMLYRSGEFTIVKCKICGLIYTNPRLSRLSLNELYNNHYFKSDNHLTLGYENYLGDYENIIKTFKKRWSVIEKYLKTHCRVLDIGCAYGFLLKYLNEKKYETYGIEISKNAAQYAVDKLGLNVINKSLREAKFSDNFFDVITVWDVIEHFTDPSAELLYIYRILKPSGILSIITPDSSSLQAKFWGKKWVEYLRPSEHLYFFSKKILIKKITSMGFNVIYVGTAGKFVSIKFVIDRLKAYNKNFFNVIDKLTNLLGLNKKVLYVDPKDKMFINFQKK